MALLGLQRQHGSYAQTQQDIRVEDFLDDKLQTTADLGLIDGLLEDVKRQQSLLDQQLREARSDHGSAASASKDHRQSLRSKARKFQDVQLDIDLRLRIVTQSEASDDAVNKFGSIMQSLQMLDLAQEYMALLGEVERLSDEARANFKKLPQNALKPYLRLQSLIADLQAKQPAAEGAAPHLVDHVEQVTNILWKQMKEAFAQDFEVTLKKMKWPGKDLTMEGLLADEWTEGVKKLLDLQTPELQNRYRSGITPSGEPLTLLPLEVMAKPLVLRFKYHFEGDRPTNKLDKASIPPSD
ncbi:uncharacterized protein KY384_005849 [Bacidia gigantensis]|uniref:uncharacterized protein n=1 Tax=Bacidia gigantensis TaxID=2732470 RepID=UPI001D03C243|nr:uncharacterized protein KY384_005849 [Bacidia gigantensis]KAG8529214.1 hypothetical protein KY384_005849 [Bacidia gigantensis]